jgi:hypothetical protein
LEALYITFKCLNARNDVDGWRFRASGEHASDLDGRESNDRYDWYQYRNNPGVHVDFLVWARDAPAPPADFAVQLRAERPATDDRFGPDRRSD